MRTLFFGSHNSHPSHPISALTVSSAHSILVPLAMIASALYYPVIAHRRLLSGVGDEPCAPSRHAARGASRSAPLFDEFADPHPQRLGEPPQYAQRRIMQPELDPRQIAAAHVGSPGERLLTQATGRSQPLELLRQRVHAGPLLPISHSLSSGQSRPTWANCGQSPVT